MFKTVTITPEQEAESERLWRDIDTEEALRLAWTATSTPKPMRVVEARTRAARLGWGGVVVWNSELLDPGILVPHEFNACECRRPSLFKGCACQCHGIGGVYRDKT